MLDLGEVKLEWLGHASFKIQGDKNIYIDPYNVDEPEAADIILITHSHYDHCSIEDLRDLSNESTVIVAPPDCQSKLKDIKKSEVILVAPSKKFQIGDIEIETVPAYNLDKQFHPKANNWVGYIVTVAGKRFYHAGDTDAVPEMAELKDIDVAMLPVGGTYTMTAEEAAKACNAFKPKIAVPMHWGSIVGGKSDAERFKELCEAEVRIL